MGHPEMAFCNSWRPRCNHLHHEVLVTDFLLCYPDIPFVRGWQVDSKVLPDAEMTIAEQRFFVELDTGEQSYVQVEKRQTCYAHVSDFLLYVTASERRMLGLIKHARAVRAIALFTTLASVQADARGAIWRDWTGKTVSLFGKQD